MTSKIPTISQLLEDNIPEGWTEVFKDASDELQHVSKLLERYESKNTISYPRRNDIFKAFRLTKLEDIKVVIIANEPVNGIGCNGAPLSNGLALSVHREEATPKTTQSLYSILQNQYPNFKNPGHGDLTEWASRGIFLLQLSLTIDPEDPESHSELWTGFIAKVLESIMKTRKHTPFILFGKKCNRISNFISGSCPTYPIGNTYKMDDDLKEVFLKIDTFLIKHGGTAMDWSLS
jgi:uracil-DNA glycosylase